MKVELGLAVAAGADPATGAAVALDVPGARLARPRGAVAVAFGFGLTFRVPANGVGAITVIGGSSVAAGVVVCAEAEVERTASPAKRTGAAPSAALHACRHLLIRTRIRPSPPPSFTAFGSPGPRPKGLRSSLDLESKTKLGQEYRAEARRIADLPSPRSSSRAGHRPRSGLSRRRRLENPGADGAEIRRRRGQVHRPRRRVPSVAAETLGCHFLGRGPSRHDEGDLWRTP